MATLFSRSRVAGVALAASLLIAACGGGGSGGGTEPPDPVDKAPPTVGSTTPADGAKDVDDGLAQIIVKMKEDGGNIKCPTKNPLTVTKENGEEVKGGTPACDPATKTLSLTFATKALFRDETYTPTLAAGIEDMAGNKSAAYSWSFTTKGPVDRTPSVVTANAGTTADPRYTSVVNTTTGATSHTPFGGAPLGTNAVAVDSKAGRAYYTATISPTGCAYSMDLETHTVDCIKVNPLGSTYGRSVAVALANQGVYFATSSEYSPEKGNEILVFDRLSLGEKLATVALPDATHSPSFMIADREGNRMYVLSYDKSSAVFNPWPDYLPGFPGKVYEIDTTTNTRKRTFVVGSGPRGAAIDFVKKLLYVSNWGDRTISIINLVTGAVRTVKLPSFFVEDDKYFQRPVGLALAGTKLLIANSRFSKVSLTDQVGGLEVLDLASETITQTIPVGDIPLYMAQVGNDVWVTTGNTASKRYSVVQVSLTKGAAVGSVAVGPSPVGIDAYAP